MLQELHDMASDPDDEHTHIIASFNDMAGLVEKMSATTCDAPAVVDSGKEVTLIIEDCEVCALCVWRRVCVCARQRAGAHRHSGHQNAHASHPLHARKHALKEDKRRLCELNACMHAVIYRLMHCKQ